MASAGTQPVLIAGGGIGGLAAALGLAQKGIASILLEKSVTRAAIPAITQRAGNTACMRLLPRVIGEHI